MEPEWKELPDYPDVHSRPRRKLKLYADANVPKPLVDDLRASGLSIDYAQEEGLGSVPDEQIRQRARKRGRVLLTFDPDFWNDREHPLQAVGGIIFVDMSTDRIAHATNALARFWVRFAKDYSLDQWTRMKARVTEHSYTIKMATWDGKIAETQFKVDKGKTYFREFR